MIYLIKYSWYNFQILDITFCAVIEAYGKFLFLFCFSLKYGAGLYFFFFFIFTSFLIDNMCPSTIRIRICTENVEIQTSLLFKNFINSKPGKEDS